MTFLRHALEDERHCPVADGGDPPALAGPYDWLVANLRANGLLREAEAVRLLVDAQADRWRDMLRRYHAASQRVYAAIGSVDGAEQRAAADACRALESEVGEALAAQPAGGEG